MGNVSTAGLDFACVKFDLRPWSKAAEHRLRADFRPEMPSA
jgi:hypothetical protein